MNSLGDIDYATKIFEKIIQLNDPNGDDFYNLGALYAKKGKNKEAYQAFKQAIKVEPDNKAANDVLNRTIIENHSVK